MNFRFLIKVDWVFLLGEPFGKILEQNLTNFISIYLFYVYFVSIIAMKEANIFNDSNVPVLNSKPVTARNLLKLTY